MISKIVAILLIGIGLLLMSYGEHIAKTSKVKNHSGPFYTILGMVVGVSGIWIGL